MRRQIHFIIEVVSTHDGFRCFTPEAGKTGYCLSDFTREADKIGRRLAYFNLVVTDERHF